MLRLRVSDPDLPWTDRDRIALDKLLREHARLTAALDDARADTAEAMRYADRGREDAALLAAIRAHCRVICYPPGMAYPIEHAPFANKDAWRLIEQSLSAARTQPEGSNG